MGTFLSERYELVRHVADGPIAALHEGRLRGSAGFARPVAIRALEPRYARDPRFVGAWAAAATEVAGRPSPHLEEVVDLVVDGERVHVVTEWVEGLSLASFLATYEHPPWTLVTRALVGLLDGLHRLHSIDPPLVHRGVSAASVRLSIDGAVKLTRTGVAGGLAAIGEGRTEAEARGLMHAAPELLDGHGATPATDVFGLGALALEALAAGPAFVGGDLTEPRDLASVRKDVPPLLVALVERALRPEPDDRFESADEMARALERLLHAEPTPVDAASLARAVRAARGRAPKGRPGPAALAATLSRMKADPAPVKEAVPTKKKRPVGLPEQRTLHVDDTELMVLDSKRPPPAAAEEAEPVPEDEPRKRYKFEPKERDATRRAQGLAHAESEAAPFVLDKVKGAATSKTPRGLGPAKTEFLDEGEVDRLTLDPGRAPRGLAPAKTELLDEGEVDRLTLEPERPKAPRGLAPAKTEFLDEGEVDRLTLGPDQPKAPRGLAPAKTEFLDEDEVDRLRVDEEE